jgi:hypothetical protein
MEVLGALAALVILTTVAAVAALMVILVVAAVLAGWDNLEFKRLTLAHQEQAVQQTHQCVQAVLGRHWQPLLTSQAWQAPQFQS